MPNVSVFPLPASEPLPAWRARLSASLALRADPDARVEQVFYDSFDWRLYAAGLCLTSFRQDSTIVLQVLRLTDLASEAELLVDRLDTRFAAALPDGRLRRLIEPLLGVRAFLPVTQLVIERTCLRKVDKDGKTRVRLYLESCRRLASGGESQPLQQRLRLEALRGYAAAAKKLKRQLESDYPLVSHRDQLYRSALADADRSPLDHAPGMTVELAADGRADAALRQVLVVLLQHLQANEAGAMQDLDSEFLHDLRVAVRRTRSLLAAFKTAFPPAVGARLRRELAWLSALSSRVRDLDVYQLKLHGYLASLSAHQREDLEPLQRFLQFKQRQAHTSDLIPALRSQRYRRLKQQWQRMLDAAPARRPVARDALTPIAQLASQRIWHLYKRARKAGRAVSPETAPQALHELRKTCKKLRYLMDSFASLYPPASLHAAVKALKPLQKTLGDFQDLVTQSGAFDGYRLEMRRRGEYSAATDRAMALLLGTLDQAIQTARGDVQTRLRKFGRPVNDKRFRELFRPAP